MAGLSTPERKKLAIQTASLNQSGSEESLGINTYIHDDDSESKEPLFEGQNLGNKILINDHHTKLPQSMKAKDKTKSKTNAGTSLKFTDNLIQQTFSIDDLQKFSKNDIQQLLLEDLTSQRRGSDMR